MPGPFAPPIDHAEAEAAIQTFSFKAPEAYMRHKVIVKLTTYDVSHAAGAG